MMLSAFLRYLVICTGILYSEVLEVMSQGVPSQEECTPMAIAGCYFEYNRVLFRPQLRPDNDGHYNNTAYHATCNALKEKSPCDKRTDKCPQKAGMDLTRQQKGYQLLRDFVCDTELLKDFQTAVACKDQEKLAQCEPPPPSEHEHQQFPFDPKGERCRTLLDAWACHEETLYPDCPVPASRAKAAYAKARGAFVLLLGCDYNLSGAPSVVPQGIFLCIAALYSLRRMRAL